MFHVDDLKISHKDEDIVTKIINKLDEKYGAIMPISISRGKVHYYLGMVFDYTNPGEVLIHMYQYIDNMVAMTPQRYKEGMGSATAAPTNLYEVRDPNSNEVEPLSKQYREEYHSLTAHSTYLSKRARPDLQT